MDVVVRASRPSDEPLIFSSWTKGAYQCAPAHWVPRDIFIPRQTAHVRRCLDACGARVAVHPDDDAEIVGWACTTEFPGLMVIHWAYVKQLFRRLGVGAHLIGWADAYAVTQASKYLGTFVKEKRVLFDPYFWDRWSEARAAA
jgi:GNAT superfamily N-acetyltransferase